MSILNSKQLTAKINSIKGSSVKLRDAIQEALVSCAYYTAVDGDPASFNRLLDAVGTNTRIKGLTLWIETWGFARIKEGKFVLNTKARTEAGIKTEADFAPFETMMRAAVAWYDMVPVEKAVSVFDPINYITGVVSKLEKEHQAELAQFVKNAVNDFNKAKVLEALKAQAPELLSA